MHFNIFTIRSFSDKFLPIFIVILALVMLNPYFVWGRYRSFIVACLLLVLLLFLMNSLKRRVLQVNLVLLAGVVFICMVLFFLGSDASFGWALLQGICAGLLLLIYDQFGNRLLVTLKYFFVIMLIPAMLLWIWHALGFPVDIWQIGVISDNVVPNQLKVVQGMHYYKYVGSVELDYMIDAGLPLYRMCGLYDEPGVVGTVAGLLLAADRMCLRKKINILLFVAGVMSLSLAFFILVTLTLILNLRWKTILLFILLMAPLIFMLPSSTYNFLAERTVSRMAITDSANFAGNNREEMLFKTSYNNWLAGDMLQVVFGGEAINDGSSSFKQILINTGLMGVALIVVVWCVPFLRKGISYAAIVFFIIFLASVYQRPVPLHFPFFMIFWCGIMGLSGGKRNLVKRERG